jgi:hypothetical protein
MMSAHGRRRQPAPMATLRQRGAFAVEAALVLPVLITLGFIGTDIQRIHSERIRVENAASTLALNLAAQPELSVAGLDALANIAMQGHTEQQQLIVLNVLQSGRIRWALLRGGAQELCQAPTEGGYYTGELPEDPPEENRNNADSDDDTSSLSLVVVLACRDSSDIALSGQLLMPEVLETRSIYRVMQPAITLDATLQEESQSSGLAYAEGQT